MTELLTSAQMRAIERAAIDSGQVTGLQLMERAGHGVVEAILARWPKLADSPDPAPHTATVLCGPGNNGGDGFVVARLLHQRGWQVEVLLCGSDATLPPDAAHNCATWRSMGPVRQLALAAAAEGARPDLLIDALFGIGVSRPLPLELCAAFAAVKARPIAAGRRQSPCRVVAIDCPSGLDCDTGLFLLPPSPDGGPEKGELDPGWAQGEAAPRRLIADLAVTFHAPKIGHMLVEDSIVALHVADIGLTPAPQDAAWLADAPLSPDRVRLVDPVIGDGDRGARAWLQRCRGEGSHKFDRGHALILGGGPGQGGAARLAARGALRAGAGLVTIGCPPEALAENAARLDAIMLRPLADAGALELALQDKRISALCLGPGLGIERARALVPVALAAGRRTVLDADALTAFRDAPETLFRLCRAAADVGGPSRGGVVMTPHEGEFARLFPDLSGPGRRGRSKIDVVREAARRSGATVLLKGAVTVIARPDGVASVHAAVRERAAPQLATAGAGDVLAGFITGLIASPMASEPYRGVELAAWLHVECARSFGPGLIAEDLPEELPKVFRALGL